MKQEFQQRVRFVRMARVTMKTYQVHACHIWTVSPHCVLVASFLPSCFDFFCLPFSFSTFSTSVCILLLCPHYLIQRLGCSTADSSRNQNSTPQTSPTQCEFSRQTRTWSMLTVEIPPGCSINLAYKLSEKLPNWLGNEADVFFESRIM